MAKDIEQIAGKAADDYSFQVPFDGTNKFYDEKDHKAFKDGFLQCYRDHCLPVVAALSELVELKRIKDTEGKTPDYEKRQPLAWEQAKSALSQINSK